MLRFAVYAGVAVVIAVGAGLWLSRADALGRARADVKADANFLADRLGQDDLARTAFLWPRRADAAETTSLLDDFLDPKSVAKNVVRLTLVSPDGIVTYSTDHGLVGRRLGRVPEGERMTQVAGTKVLESYVPVNWVMDPSRPRGYLGLDRDYGPVAGQVRRTFAVQAGTIALALLMLYLALLPIMHRLTAKLERALAESMELASIVEHSNDAIVGRDGDGLIRSWNAAAERLYGWRADEVYGKTIDLLLPEGDGQRPEHAQELALTRTSHLRKDGKPVRVAVTISPIRAEEGPQGSSMTARDVTALVALEQELHDAQQQETVARIATSVASELDELVSGLALTDAGVRGLELVRRLQTLGHVQENHPEVVDVNELVTDLHQRLQLQLSDGVELVIETAAEWPTVTADPERLRHVVLDLALSSRAAMPDGGRVTIRTEDVDFSRRAASQRPDAPAALETGSYVMLAVSDTGGAQHGERMGLGLATVFELVELSGGTVGIESRPGSGTTVRVYLPRAEAAARALVA